ncbi:Hypothetical predicted protein, partial [Pelobates cultripes]
VLQSVDHKSLIAVAAPVLSFAARLLVCTGTRSSLQISDPAIQTSEYVPLGVCQKRRTGPLCRPALIHLLADIMK